MDWQAAGRLEFSFRALAPLSLHGAVPPPSLLSHLSLAALESMRALEKSSGDADSAATAAVLRVSSTVWSEHARSNPEVLFALVPGKGGCCDRLLTRTFKLMPSARVSHWCRFAEDGAAAASPWPPPPVGQSGYSLALLRLPHSVAALEMAAAAAATVLACGAPLFVFGCASEGAAAMEARIGALRSPLGHLYFERVAVIAEAARSDIYGACVVRAYRRTGVEAAVTLDAFEKRSELYLPGAMAPVDWRAYPGLFAGGGLDVMTKVLLQALLPALCPSDGNAGVRSRGRVLDFCCGSGAIAAVLAHAMPNLRISMLDADAVALVAARANVPSAALILSDAWSVLPLKPRFDAIVSNPPVHHGLLSDMSILRALIRRAAARLRPGGTLWLVCQEYVPARSILDEERRRADERGMKARLQPAEAVHDDGRFVVWRAVRSAGRASAGACVHEGKRKR
jgi:16S rRNA G1207 methylase RsmC